MRRDSRTRHRQHSPDHHHRCRPSRPSTHSSHNPDLLLHQEVRAHKEIQVAVHSQKLSTYLLIVRNSVS